MHLCLGRAAWFIGLTILDAMDAQDGHLWFCAWNLQPVAFVSHGWRTDFTGIADQRFFAHYSGKNLPIFSVHIIRIIGCVLLHSYIKGWDLCSSAGILASSENPLAKIGFWQYNRCNIDKGVRL